MTYTSIIIENVSTFSKKMKDRDFQRIFDYKKKDLNMLIKYI